MIIKDFLIDKLNAEHSRTQANRITDWIGDDAERFEHLMDIFLGDEYRLTQRAAWVVSTIGQQKPYLLEPFLQKMLDLLRREGIHDAVKRNVVRLFETLPIDASIEGDLADICFRFLADPKEKAAIRAFSIGVLARICKTNPELKSELMLIVEDNLIGGKPSFLSRARRIVK